MAVKKVRLSKPSESSKGLNNKVRFNFNKKVFIVANSKGKSADGKDYKNESEALAAAIALQK